MGHSHNFEPGGRTADRQKDGSTTWPQAKLNAGGLCPTAAPKGRGAQRRVIRPGAHRFTVGGLLLGVGRRAVLIRTPDRR